MTTKILIATKNLNKFKEIAKVLDGTNFQFLNLLDFDDPINVEETASSFYENAKLKAQSYASAYNCIALSDDSGLCVQALNDAPGIFSARYAGPDATDSDNNQKLLLDLSGKNQRNARFVCSLVLFHPSRGELWKTEDQVYGEILSSPSGKNGFGYDPLFFLPDHKKTMAQLSPEEKNLISHRGQALRKLCHYLKSNPSLPSI